MKTDIDHLFKKLTTFQPRLFQRETILRLLNRQDILLRAPTGAGKTETAVAPFLFAKVMGVQTFPNKLIYIVPLRTLATSLRDRVEKYVRTWENTEEYVRSWKNNYQPKRPLVVTLQTGENPEDPRFEGDIIFCTIDQLLSSFLSIPYSVGRGSANVNAGVVFASYLVFDELHLLDPDRSFVTTLELLKQVQGISPFLLMTATLTKELAEQIRQEIKGLNPSRKQASDDVIQLMNVESADLETIETRQRYFEPASAPLTAQGIWADIQQHQRKRVIALCNTVAQAQGLFQSLRDLVDGQPVKVLLLHSRFLPSDRKAKEFDDRFREAVFEGEQSAAKDLIRHVDNRSIFMVAEELTSDQEMPGVDLWSLEAFSVPRTTLLKVFREFQESHARDWIFKEVVQPEKKKSEGYSLPVAKPIAHQREITTSFRLLVNPRYADYNDEVGLQLGVNDGNYLSQVKPVKTASQEYCYHMDTYVGHLGRMWTCWHQAFPPVQPKYQSMRDEQLQAGGWFIRRKFFPRATREQAEAFFELLVFLAVITHDLGKLQIQWQTVMCGWQAIAHKHFKGTDSKDQLIAHTDYDPTDEVSKDNEGRIQKDSNKEYEKQNPRPPHAIESAFLSYEILDPVLAQVLEQTFQVLDGEVIDNIRKVVEMAAGRHHSAWTAGWESDTLAEIRQDKTRRGKLQLHTKTNEAIAQSWQRLIGKELPKILPLPTKPPVLSQLIYDVEEIPLNCFSSDQMQYQQLYWLVVRGLRICDGRSVQIGGVKK